MNGACERKWVRVFCVCSCQVPEFALTHNLKEAFLWIPCICSHFVWVRVTCKIVWEHVGDTTDEVYVCFCFLFISIIWRREREKSLPPSWIHSTQAHNYWSWNLGCSPGFPGWQQGSRHSVITGSPGMGTGRKLHWEWSQNWTQPPKFEMQAN